MEVFKNPSSKVFNYSHLPVSTMKMHLSKTALVIPVYNKDVEKNIHILLCTQNLSVETSVFKEKGYYVSAFLSDIGHFLLQKKFDLVSGGYEGLKTAYQ